MNSKAPQSRQNWYRNRSNRNQSRNQMRNQGNPEHVHRNPTPAAEQANTASEFAFKFEDDGTNRFTISPNMDPERLEILLKEVNNRALAEGRILINLNKSLSDKNIALSDTIDQLAAENERLKVANGDLAREVNTLSIECMAKTQKQIRSDRDLKVAQVHESMLSFFVEPAIEAEIDRSSRQFYEDSPEISGTDPSDSDIPLSTPTEEYYRSRGTCVHCGKAAHGQEIDCTCFCGRRTSKHSEHEQEKGWCIEACWCARRARHTFSKHIADYPYSHPYFDVEKDVGRLAKWDESCQVCGSTNHETKNCKVFPSNEPKTCICGHHHFYNNCQSKCKGIECGNEACKNHCFHCARPLERHESWECKVLRDDEGYGDIRRFECLDCGRDYVVGGNCLCTDEDGDGV